MPVIALKVSHEAFLNQYIYIFLLFFYVPNFSTLETSYGAVKFGNFFNRECIYRMLFHGALGQYIKNAILNANTKYSSL